VLLEVELPEEDIQALKAIKKETAPGGSPDESVQSPMVVLDEGTPP
jgi:hypothetical protein